MPLPPYSRFAPPNRHQHRNPVLGGDADRAPAVDADGEERQREQTQQRRLPSPISVTERVPWHALQVAKQKQSLHFPEFVTWSDGEPCGPPTRAAYAAGGSRVPLSIRAKKAPGSWIRVGLRSSSLASAGDIV